MIPDAFFIIVNECLGAKSLLMEYHFIRTSSKWARGLYIYANGLLQMGICDKRFV